MVDQTVWFRQPPFERASTPLFFFWSPVTDAGWVGKTAADGLVYTIDAIMEGRHRMSTLGYLFFRLPALLRRFIKLYPLCVPDWEITGSAV